MCKITDFYQYKYSRSNYYIYIYINIQSALGLNRLLKEKIKDKRLNKEYKCAYMLLKDNINRCNMDSYYVKLKLNKCYLKYLKDLYYDFYDREESLYIKELIQHIQYFLEEDNDNICKFYDLVESTKINILSKI